MIGIEAYNIFIGAEALLNIGEEMPDAAVGMGEALPELLLIDAELRQANARDMRIDVKEALTADVFPPPGEI